MNHLKEEKTFVLIKPDGVQKGLIGEIIKRFEQRDLKIVALELFQPTAEEIAETIGEMTATRVREILKIAQDTTSLETPVGDEDDSMLGDFIADTSQPTPIEAASRELLKENIEEVLSSLTDREARVLRMRFGLDSRNPMTLEEVGREFGVTRERIRQIEAKALRKLKHPSRRKKLQDYLD